MKLSLQIEIEDEQAPGTASTVMARLRNRMEIQKVVPMPDRQGNRKLLAICEPNSDLEATLKYIQRLPHVLKVERRRIL